MIQPLQESKKRKEKDDAARRFNVEKLEVIPNWAQASLGLFSGHTA